MAEPVSREAWSRLVALLNAYVSENSNAFSHSGPIWKKERWAFEHSGLNFSDEWSFPDRISRIMVKSMFDWCTDAEIAFRAFCASVMFKSDLVVDGPSILKRFCAQPGVSVGSEVLVLLADPTYSRLSTSKFNELGPILGTNLLNFVTQGSLRLPSIDQFVIDWMIEYGQVSDNWALDLSTFDSNQYQRYSDWCRQALDRFRESGHLPDHCDDHSFIGFLMGSDRLNSLTDSRFSAWVGVADRFHH